MAICVFSTISYSIVKCSFVCLFVVALDPRGISLSIYDKYFYKMINKCITMFQISIILDVE